MERETRTAWALAVKGVLVVKAAATPKPETAVNGTAALAVDEKAAAGKVAALAAGTAAAATGRATGTAAAVGKVAAAAGKAEAAAAGKAAEAAAESSYNAARRRFEHDCGAVPTVEVARKPSAAAAALLGASEPPAGWPPSERGCSGLEAHRQWRQRAPAPPSMEVVAAHMGAGLARASSAWAEREAREQQELEDQMERAERGAA